VSDVIPLRHVELKAEEVEAMARLLRNAPEGAAVDAFEEAFGTSLDRPCCVSTTSGGTAVEIALAASGVQRGDRVLVPAVGASAAIAATSRLGAVPICVDVDPQTLCMRPGDAEKLIDDSVKAIVGSADLGCPAGLDGLARLATRSELPMIELVGAALGASVTGEQVGRFGRIAVFDFSAASALSTGTGGAILTNDDHLAVTMRALRDGRRAVDADGQLMVNAAGMDAPLDDLRASLGMSRLDGIANAIEVRKEIAACYFRRLSGNSDLILQAVPDGVEMSWCRMIVRLSDRFSREERDEIMEGMSRHEIGVNTGIQLASDTIAPATVDGMPCPIAERAADRSIALPLHNTLEDREIDLVCQTLELMMQRTSFRRS
jgi:perosamine synthetase